MAIWENFLFSNIIGCVGEIVALEIFPLEVDLRAMLLYSAGKVKSIKDFHVEVINKDLVPELKLILDQLYFSSSLVHPE